MGFLNAFVRGMGYGIGRQLVYSAVRSSQLGPASTVLANRRAVLSLGYLTPELVIAYVGDRVRYLDTSRGSGVLVLSPTGTCQRTYAQSRGPHRTQAALPNCQNPTGLSITSSPA